jgi:dethiobiotin synthetase
MFSIFVTATDTDAGKSFLTAALSRALLAAGRDVLAIKPVCCGRSETGMNTDVAALLAAQGMDEAQAADINLYDFPAFAAPLFAARSGAECVDPARLVQWCRERFAGHELTLIEGVGGLMVPMAQGFLLSDWLQELPEARVLLVVRARLGGINQALLTLDKLQRMGRHPDWVVVNAVDASGEATLEQHCAAIAPYMGTTGSLHRLPWLPDPTKAEEYIAGSQLFREISVLDSEERT